MVGQIHTETEGGSLAQGYRRFREENPVFRVSTRDMVWMYHVMGPENANPIVFVHGTSGTAAVFYQQMRAMAAKDYRVFSVQYPGYQRSMDFCKGFDLFLDAVNVKQAHFFGTSLSGYLLQKFCVHFSHRVASLMLCNSFANTIPFYESSACASLLPLMPHFMLKSLIVDAFPRLALDIESKNATEFMAAQLDDITATDLSARLTLNCEGVNCPALPIDQERITLIESHDHTVLSPDLRKDQRSRYPDAKVAWLKDGGDFPFLSRPDEINMHVEVHMRRIEGFVRGVEPEDETAILARELAEQAEEERLEALRLQKLAERQRQRNPFENEDVFVANVPRPVQHPYLNDDVPFDPHYHYRDENNKLGVTPDSTIEPAPSCTTETLSVE